MKLLFITTKSPLPANDGHSLRSSNLLKQLAKRHEVHLLSFVKFKEEFDYLDELKQLCGSVRLIKVPENESRLATCTTLMKSVITGRPFVLLKYNSRQMSQAIDEMLRSVNFDLIHIDMLPLGVYYDKFFNKKIVLDAHNVESYLLRRRVEQEHNPAVKWFFSKQQAGLECFERSLTQKVDHILACSADDQAILQKFAPNTPVSVIPNGVDTAFFYPRDPRKKKNNRLVFIGGLNWYPNKDGLVWFDKEVMPYIYNKRPDVVVNVIGRKESIKWRHADQMHMLGYVDDIREFMEEAAVFIVPLRIGGGTRLKILNAMAMECPVVSTTIGAEGLGARNGHEIAIADDPKLFADTVLKLMEDSEAAENLGKKARSFITENYDWNLIGVKLNKIYNDLVK